MNRYLKKNIKEIFKKIKIYTNKCSRILVIIIVYRLALWDHSAAFNQGT